MKLLKAAASENRYYSRPQHLKELQLKISISRKLQLIQVFVPYECFEQSVFIKTRPEIVRVVDVVARKVLKLDMLEHGSGHRRDPADGAGDTFFPELFGKLH